MSQHQYKLKAKSVAIVGAGPSGVIAAKYLRAENAFDKIVLFEQRSQPGGIWNYTPDQTSEPLFSIPQTDPDQPNQTPLWRNSKRADDVNVVNGNTCEKKEAEFCTAMYADLETNIPRGLMGFQDLSWPKDSQLFPTRETVRRYIEDYGRDVQHLIRYATQVSDIRPLDNEDLNSPWALRSISLITQDKHTETFDSIIVATGHFNVPFVPPIPGLAALNTTHPGLVTHSKYFRHASAFAGKKVLVIGNSASGADISNQIAQHCATPLLWSSRSTSQFSKTHGSSDALRRPVTEVTRFEPETRTAVFADGTREADLDAVLCATGYLYSLPFLRSLAPPPITTGARVEHTYQHLFFAPRPSLAFLALPQRVIPFPLAEAQAAVLARVYAGRLLLSSAAEIEDWERDAVRENGAGKTFHLLPFPRDADYINAMSRWAASAARSDVAENGGAGKEGPVWGGWEYWCREKFPEIRRAFGALGEKRREVRSVEELGFVFEERDGAREIVDVGEGDVAGGGKTI